MTNAQNKQSKQPASAAEIVEIAQADELAALLDIKPSTISHHLTRMQKARLVSAKAEQYYHTYSLEAQMLLTITPLMRLIRIAIRIKSNQPLTAPEIDAMIQSYQKADGQEIIAQRASMVQEGLLELTHEGLYLRPTLIGDHPAMQKLHAEAVARQSKARCN